jgi:hypothetical protein
MNPEQQTFNWEERVIDNEFVASKRFDFPGTKLGQCEPVSEGWAGIDRDTK